MRCGTSKKDNYTYFGGKIINPKSNFVILSNGNDFNDTISLSTENRFLESYENLKEGLYFFKHGVEFQFVYLAPKDSLLLRLNTWDFDESLVFSGKNAQRNNLLINNFMNQENSQKTIREFHKLTPSKFKKQIDSLITIKKEALQDFIDQNNENSEQFINIATISLIYPLYTEIEGYIIQNSLLREPIKLPLGFDIHRKNISFNNENLLFYSPYSSLLFENIYSEVYQQNIKRNSDEFTIALFDNIDKKISSEKLKNEILKNTLIRYFIRKSTCKINNKTFEYYYKKCTNKEDVAQIKKMVKDAKNLRHNDKLNEFTVLDFNRKKHNANELVRDHPSLIYFRNNNFSSNEWVASRINYLLKKHPKTSFFIINMDENSDPIKNMNTKNQFYLPKNSKAHEFLTSKFPRVILVNKNGIVSNGFASLSSPRIYKQISFIEN